MAKNNHTYQQPAWDDDLINRLMKGELTDSEMQQMSSDTEDHALLADAIEGLSRYDDMDMARKQAAELNQKLSEQLKSRKNYRKNPIGQSSLVVWITIILVLALAIVGFFLIKTKGL